MDQKEKREHVIMEGNLLEYPIFSMQKSRVDKTIEEYVWQERNDVGEITGERRFKVDCTKGVPKIKQTLYMSKKACKVLWHNRAETGEPMSHTVEQLILEHIGKK